MQVENESRTEVENCDYVSAGQRDVCKDDC